MILKKTNDGMFGWSSDNLTTQWLDGEQEAKEFGAKSLNLEENSPELKAFNEYFDMTASYMFKNNYNAAEISQFGEFPIIPALPKTEGNPEEVKSESKAT